MNDNNHTKAAPAPSMATQSPHTYYRDQLNRSGVVGEMIPKTFYLYGPPSHPQADPFYDASENRISEFLAGIIVGLNNYRGIKINNKARVESWVAALVRRNNRHEFVGMESLESALSLYDRLYCFRDELGNGLEGAEFHKAKERLDAMSTKYLPEEIFYTCLLIAYKNLDDKLVDNISMAKMMDIPISKLNALEIDVFETLNFIVGFRIGKLSMRWHETDVETMLKGSVKYSVMPVIVPPKDLPDLDKQLVDVNFIEVAPTQAQMEEQKKHYHAKWS